MRELSIAGFERVLRVELGDEPGAGVAFVAVHALVDGRAFGEIRVRAYDDEQRALADALDLARAMSRKVVMAGLPGGGAKSVVCLPVPDRPAALARLGEVIEGLGGQYWCGPDLGFTDDDDAALRRATRYVARAGLASYTARSVHAAALAAAGGVPERAAVQGLGAVGRPLAELLSTGGAKVVAANPAVTDPRWEAVAPKDIYDVPCDVFAPCAAGGVLDAAVIERLRCRVVCGGANNPLADPHGAARLAARGILLVPDFLANGGATIAGVCTALGKPDEIEPRMSALPARVGEILATARREGRTPLEVAIEQADRRLAELRAG